nr:hypothetical protein [Tanacetum cinerariifolium]
FEHSAFLQDREEYFGGVESPEE